MKRLGNIHCSLLSLALAAALFAPTLLAQESNEANLPEEIIVNAPESLRNLRLEINRAQEAMFNVFNELNDDDRFDIHCEYVRRWQSKIREQVCGPAYLKTAQEQEVNLLLNQFGHVSAEKGGAGVTQMDHYNAMLEEKMKAVFEEHPQFREALDDYNSLTEYLKEVRTQRFDLDD